MDFDKFDTIGLAKTVETLVREAVSPLSCSFFNRDLKIQRRTRREKNLNKNTCEKIIETPRVFWSTLLTDRPDSVRGILRILVLFHLLYIYVSYVKFFNMTLDISKSYTKIKAKMTAKIQSRGINLCSSFVLRFLGSVQTQNVSWADPNSN